MERNEKEKRIRRVYDQFVGFNSLLVGCGMNGETAEIAANYPQFRFLGIDPEVQEAERGENWRVEYGDGMNLNITDSSIDFAYCFHVLEHVPNPRRVLSEIHRVIVVGGTCFIGTPNKARLVSYISSDANFRTKLKWNFIDLRMKLLGKFENHFGAHAGFSKAELRNLFQESNWEVKDITDYYYSSLYGTNFLVDLILRLPIKKFLLPSNYFLIRKI